MKLLNPTKILLGGLLLLVTEWNLSAAPSDPWVNRRYQGVEQLSGGTCRLHIMSKLGNKIDLIFSVYQNDRVIHMESLIMTWVDRQSILNVDYEFRDDFPIRPGIDGTIQISRLANLSIVDRENSPPKTINFDRYLVFTTRIQQNKNETRPYGSEGQIVTQPIYNCVGLKFVNQ